MRLPPSIAGLACAALFGGAVAAAPLSDKGVPNAPAPGAVYKHDLTCAAATAALAARLPPTSSDKSKQDAGDMRIRERTAAVDAGKRMDVSEPEVDRLIAQRRDEILAHAEKSANAGKTNRELFIDALDCEMDQLGDAIQKAKAERAAREAR